MNYYQPYNNMYAQPSNFGNYLPSYSAYNNNIANNVNYQQPEVIQGTIVDSIDVVKAKNADITGQPTYYPLSDKSVIYCKQLNPQTGASMILTYKLDIPEEPKIIDMPNVDQISEMIVKLQDDMSEIKNLVLDVITAPSKGGEK